MTWKKIDDTFKNRHGPRCIEMTTGGNTRKVYKAPLPLKQTCSPFLGNVISFYNTARGATDFPYFAPPLNVSVSYPEQMVCFHVQVKKGNGDQQRERRRLTERRVPGRVWPPASEQPTERPVWKA